jgi:hypothetical protein
VSPPCGALRLGASDDHIPQFQTHHQMLVTELGMQGLWMAILVGNILGGVVKTFIVFDMQTEQNRTNVLFHKCIYLPYILIYLILICITYVPKVEKLHLPLAGME